ncbi:MAG: hypothetical protein EBV30_10845, partial [Actinobacteria bacterium]|nr:hypothetical protein [Actinomycetota bacterium]
MAIEKSPYEGTLDQKLAGQNCLGTIVSVDAEARTCRVKTIGLKHRTDDLDLFNVQWISLTASTNGDGAEDTSIPVPGQMGVVTFINNQPYIMGYYRPVVVPEDANTKAKVKDPNQTSETLINTGDRIIKTLAGNKVILRSGGSVEIESNKLCRTYWIPARRRINTVCGTYELEVEGGFMYWSRDTETDKTTLRAFIYDALSPTNALDIQVGTPEDDSKFLTMSLGAIDPTTFDVPLPVFNLAVTPAGDTDLTVGIKQQMSLSIAADTGNITLETTGSITQKVTGNVTQDIQGDISQTVKGNVTETVEGTITDTAKKAVTFATDDALKVSAKGDATVSSDGNVNVSGKGGANVTSDGSVTISGKGGAKVSSNGSAELSGKGGTDVGSGSSMTNIKGTMVNLAGGGMPVALVGGQVIGVGNLGAPVVSNIVQGSS